MKEGAAAICQDKKLFIVTAATLPGMVFYAPLSTYCRCITASHDQPAQDCFAYKRAFQLHYCRLEALFMCILFICQSSLGFGGKVISAIGRQERDDIC